MRDCYWWKDMIHVSIPKHGSIVSCFEIIKKYLVSYKKNSTKQIYSDQQNRVLLVIVFIQKVITYSCVDKIQICKHESCSIQRIEPCGKKN
jgi:hypothetical protein